MNPFDKIILIDDDPVFSFITKEIIQNSKLFNNNLLTYFNGARALNDFQETDLNKLKLLIFVDINMPVMDGWEFLDELSNSALNKSTQIYVVSSSVNKADEERALSYEIVKGYIPKPLELEKLESIERSVVY